MAGRGLTSPKQATDSPYPAGRSTSMATFFLNGKPVTVNAAPDTPMLWVLRDHLKMTGTKYGCGAALCGACTIHLDGVATRSCVTPLSAVAGKKVTSIEGLSGPVG